MKMKFILLLSLLPTLTWGAATRTLDGQFITNGSGTLTLPSSTDTLVGRATTDTLSNKSISGASNTISNLSAASIASGVLGHANGGTDVSSPGTSGNVLTSNGTNWVSSAPSSFSPSLNGSTGSPQSVSAGSGISLSSIGYVNIAFIVGNGGAVTVTATPSITAGTAVGQVLYVLGTSNTNTVTLQDEAGLAGSTLQLNGAWVGGQYSVLQLLWNGSAWNEVSRR